MSCIPVDIRRAMIDAGCRASVTAGRMRDVDVALPDAGSQPSLTAKSSISIAPSQNVGTACPTIGSVRTIRNAHPARGDAESTPTTIPKRTASARAEPASASVAGRRSRTDCSAGWLSRQESPKSPVSPFVTNRAYWVRSGSSRPRRSRVASRISGAAPGGMNPCVGSPDAWISTKTTVDARTRVVMTCANRERNERIIVCRDSGTSPEGIHLVARLDSARRPDGPPRWRSGSQSRRAQKCPRPEAIGGTFWSGNRTTYGTPGGLRTRPGGLACSY